jgi:hypothetical protein
MTAIRPGPYQSVMPDLAPDAYAALKRDIAKRGVQTAIDVDEEGVILDGHHRWRAHVETGRNDEPPTTVRAGLTEAEKASFARRQNILRRHMSRDEVRRVIEEQLRETPRRSDRSIATDLGVSPTTVGAVRRETADAASTVQAGQLREGPDGKTRRLPQSRPRPDDRADRDDDGDPPCRSGNEDAAAFRGAFGVSEAENRKRVATLSDEIKLKMFDAGLSASSMTVFHGNPFPEPSLRRSGRRRGPRSPTTWSSTAGRRTPPTTTSGGWSIIRATSRPTNGWARTARSTARRGGCASRRRSSSRAGSGDWLRRSRRAIPAGNEPHARGGGGILPCTCKVLEWKDRRC